MASDIEFDNIFENEQMFGNFLCNFWRRKPLFVKNGAKGIPMRALTEQAFDKAARCMRATSPQHVKEREGHVSFVEKISEHLPDLACLAARYAALLGTPGAWFDGVRTYSASGIGSHFDHSDNFVLQQSGTKTWTLSPPDKIERTEIAKRMLGTPGIGAAPLATDHAITFLLEPGDLLYIPLCWVHSGVSQSASLSLSLVCPAIPLQTLLLRGLRQVMTEQLIGYQPVPCFPAFLDDDDRGRRREAVRQATRTLLARLSSDDMLDTLIDRQLDILVPPSVPEAGSGIAAA